MADKYTFRVTLDPSVEADSIVEAFNKLKELYPGIRDVDISHVRLNGSSISYMYSNETRERIYYKPGCPCGWPDCIHDPMRKIAEGCAHQEDLTDAMYRRCDEEEADGDCPYYDDECK